MTNADNASTIAHTLQDLAAAVQRMQAGDLETRLPLLGDTPELDALAQAVGLSVSRVSRLIAAAKTVEPGQDWGQVLPFAQERIDALGQRIADHDAAAGELTHPVTRRQPATGQPGRPGAVRLRA